MPKNGKSSSTVIRIRIRPVAPPQKIPRSEISNNVIQPYLTTSSVNINRKNPLLDYQQNWHRLKKKKKNQRICKFITFLTIFTLILMLIPSITLPILLLNKQQTSTDNSAAFLRWNTTGITVAGARGNNSISSNTLDGPWDVTLTWPNTMYVADRFHNRIQKFILGSPTGVTVAGRADGTSRTTVDSLFKPTAVLVDSNSNIYIADDNKYRVMLWSKNATVGTRIAGTGGYGSSLSQLSYPYGLAADDNFNTLFIADHNNHRIMKYLRNATAGTIAAGGNGRDINNTQLCTPYGIFFDNLSDSLLISNTGCNTVVNWKLGSSYWTLLGGNRNGTSGTTSTELKSPSDVMLDPMGNMYIVDQSNHRIQFFLPGEKNGATIAGITGISGSNATLLNGPIAITLDSQLNLYVTDTYNHRIQKFPRY